MGQRLTVRNVLSSVPVFEGREEVIKVNTHTVNQIIKEVVDAHYKFAPDYDLLVKEISFSRSTPLEQQLFDFCKKNLHYVIEETNYQSTRSPAGIIQLGSNSDVGVDCKHYAGYIAGVMDAINRQQGRVIYDWCYRFASYDSDPAPGHVFVVVDPGEANEVWVDPVLGGLDWRHPSPRFYKDKKTQFMPLVRLSGIAEERKSMNGQQDVMLEAGEDGNLQQRYYDQPGRNNGRDAVLQAYSGNNYIGSTQTTGAKIMAVSPALAVIPVVGWAAAGLGEVVGAALEIFGSKYNDSTNERWLIQLYQYYVLGQGSVTSDNKVSETYGQAGLAWFATVLGVPCPDNVTFNLLKGLVNNQPSTQSYEQRAKNYLANKNVNTYNIPLSQAIQAAQIADTLPYDNKPGSWKNAVAAPTIAVDASGNLLPSSGYSIVGGELISTSTGAPAGTSATGANQFSGVVAWAQANPLPALAIASGTVFLLYQLFKKKKKKK